MTATFPKGSSASEIQERSLDEVGEARAVCPHFVGLGEVREVMRQLGLGFPREVRILAVPVSDPITFSTEMTPAVAARVAEAAELARRIVSEWVPVDASP